MEGSQKESICYYTQRADSKMNHKHKRCELPESEVDSSRWEQGGLRPVGMDIGRGLLGTPSFHSSFLGRTPLKGLGMEEEELYVTCLFTRPHKHKDMYVHPRPYPSHPETIIKTTLYSQTTVRLTSHIYRFCFNLLRIVK